MTHNAEMPRRLGAAFQEVLDIGGDAQTDVIVSARPLAVITAGRIEYMARCPECRNMHRHVSLGQKTGPCGATYLLQPRRGRVT